MTTQTDRELLELAAKAAGIGLRQWVESTNEFMTTNSNGWNPLTDDGDALRLAVQLRLLVESWFNGKLECARADCPHALASEPHRGNPLAATRRAIVRAAALIGRDMP
jgi:hypothetical protein